VHELGSRGSVISWTVGVYGAKVQCTPSIANLWNHERLNRYAGTRNSASHR
jgi:hypothetical protein